MVKSPLLITGLSTTIKNNEIASEVKTRIGMRIIARRMIIVPAEMTRHLVEPLQRDGNCPCVNNSIGAFFPGNVTGAVRERIRSHAIAGIAAYVRTANDMITSRRGWRLLGIYGDKII